MNTRLTVSDARTALERYVQSADMFLPELNLVVERLMLSGKWKGMVMRLTFDSSSGFITLPVDYYSVLGGVFNHSPAPIMGEFHTYFESGPGTPLETATWLGQLQDMGDGFCTQADIIQANTETSPAIAAVPGSIVILSTGSDNGKTVRLFGIQQETGLPVTDSDGTEGELVTLAAPSVTSKFHYSKLTDVEKEVTKGPVYAWLAPTGGGTQYQLATWRPGETRPRYRRYFTGTVTRSIQVLCQRRFNIMRAESDFVPIGNLAATQRGLQSKRYEDTGYRDKAKESWDDAIYWLNNEATQSRGGAQASVPVDTWGWGQGIPQQH